METRAKSIIQNNSEKNSTLQLMSSHIYKEMFQDCFQNIPARFTRRPFPEFDLETFPVFR